MTLIELVEYCEAGRVCLVPKQGAEVPSCHEFSRPHLCDCTILRLAESIKVLHDAVKFYACRTNESEWDGPKFLTFDKFGGLCEEISGAYVAEKALERIEKIMGR